jgi:glutathione S-transferase
MQWELVLQENVHTHGQVPVQAYLSGPQWGLLDACVAPFVRQFARTDRAWFDAQPWPQLSQWLMAFESSEAFAEVMGKHPLWVAPEA